MYFKIKTKQITTVINRPELHKECDSCPYYKDDHPVDKLPCYETQCKIKELDE